MPFKSPFNCLWWLQLKDTGGVCKTSECWKMTYQMSLTFNSLLLAHTSNHRCNSEIQISAVTLWTVHEHIVANPFRSKKSSSALLVHEQQVSLKWCHSDVLARTACVLIYLPLAGTTSIWMTTKYKCLFKLKTSQQNRDKLWMFCVGVGCFIILLR